MKHRVAARIRVEKDLITRVTRALRGKGEIAISVGQEVTPEEILGSSTVLGGFRTLNLSALLSVSPRDVEPLLVRKIGQRIYKNELLALKKGGFFSGKKVVTSPTDGILEFLNQETGELKISFLPKKVTLPAGVYGIIESVDKERGLIVIRTQVSRIHGIFGSGGFRDGILTILSKKEDLITKNAILSAHEQHILVGGGLFFKDAITSAISNGVSGFITGGINAKDYIGMAGGRLIFPKKIYNDIGISMVVCEGFGSVPIGDDIFEFLLAHEGKFIFIDGNKAIISIPSFSSGVLVKIKNTKLPQQVNNPEDLDYTGVIDLNLGARVRVVGNSYFGVQGKVIAINESLSLLPSGVKDFLATIETPRRKIQVPVANLEAIV